MFWFNKRIHADYDGFIDCHSHILPGVDDGVKTMKDSLAILERYAQMGIREVVFTPHVMEDVPNTPEDLRKRFAAFCEEYKGPVKLHLAAEYMMDHHFEEQIEKGDLLTHGDGKHILVETSYFNPPANMDYILFQLQSLGLVPILAHPERYMYMKKEQYGEIKDRGIQLQMNLGSLCGMYGSHVRERAEFLMNEGLYDMAGSDIHRPKMIEGYLAVQLKKVWALPMPEHL